MTGTRRRDQEGRSCANGQRAHGLSEFRVAPSDVHKRNPDRVWVDAAEPQPDGGLKVSYSIPRHRRGPRLAELLEVQRQAGLAHAHRILAVSHGAVFALQVMELTVLGTAPRLETELACGVVNVRAAAIKSTSRGIVRSAVHHFAFGAGNVPLARGTTAALFVDPDVYARWRGRRPALDRVADCGFDQASARATPLVVDGTDPILSDHDSEHVTAMALACAVERGVSREKNGARLIALSMTFRNYIEHSPTPIVITRLVDEEGSLSGLVVQDRVACATFTGCVTPVGPSEIGP